MPFVNTPKQKEAVKVIKANTTSMLEGGARSGKTLLNLKMISNRGIMYPDTKHLIAMFRFSDVKRAIWYESMPKLDKIMGLKGIWRPNKSDWFYQGPKGSQIWVGGLDDKERADKILGQEYATIYFPEVSRIPFSSYEIARTRGNPPKGMPLRILMDQNPPAKGHWTYKMFHERKLPDGSPVPDNDFGHIRMNPMDNTYLSEDYIEKNLKTLSAAKRQRFLYGEYGDESGALWQRSWFKYKDASIDDMQRMVIGEDPSGSKDGDEVGIVVAGTDGQDFYIFDDLSVQGTPKEWGDVTERGYERYKVDCVAAEKNYGGEMVEATITDMGRNNINVKLVSATRGKIVRAEPISALYERGRVYHVREFPDLESELCMYTGDPAEKSPNRLDALVWALTELSEGELSMMDVL